jgi:amino-acid N-acetyltransferase
MTFEPAQPYRDNIITLLTLLKLPVADLPETMTNFIVAIQDSVLVGVVGLEICGKYGLVRSLAVHPEHRKCGIAGKLLTRLDTISINTGLLYLYLLTETAVAYFKQKNYITITRDDVPKAIQQASQFSYVCPVSAVVMRKKI